MSATQEIQKYLDEIYGPGVYQAEYEAFRGFYARSLTDVQPPHSIFLGAMQGQAHAKLDELSDLMAQRVGTVAEAAHITGLPEQTIYSALQTGRVAGRKTGGTWLVTVGAIREAQAGGQMRPRIGRREIGGK